MAYRREIAEILKQSGFRLVEGVLRKDLDSEWSILVALGPLNRREDASVTVGLRSESVQKALSGLDGLEDFPYVATAAADLGYVLGGTFKIWSPPETPQLVVENIHAGLDRIRPFAELERLLDAFDAFPAMEAMPSAHYVMVVIELLRGRPVEVERQLAAAEKLYCRKDNDVCADFRAFEARVRQQLPG